ncbi:MAG TPA: LapA family protein [Candidatus Krumholzibacteria bacterium]|nr:LapA family protein [Candidatus Krumholzibacteria bacterium]
MRTVKTIIIVLLFALLLIVMVQNAQPVTFNFLNWRYQVSQLLLVVIVFVIGWLVGFVMGKVTGKRKEDEPPLSPRPR